MSAVPAPPTEASEADLGEHLLSVVIPVYQGERHLADVVDELVALVDLQQSPNGVPYRLSEVLLVHDCGPDDSAGVMRALAEKHEFVRPVWLTRNYGQHAATLAGMASAGGDWIVTMDEDGQHDPTYIGVMLDTALGERASVVYARATNVAPHGFVRNLASSGAKRVSRALSGSANAPIFNSFRLVLGEIGRSVAAYAGSGVYLDIALGWVADRVRTSPVELRSADASRQSGYNMRSLLSHFWRMVLTGGTRGLRLVSVLGAAFAVAGVVIAVFLIIRQLTAPVPTPGWTSLMVIVLICTGAILFSLGVVAEYVGVAVNMAMGKPLYVITQDPAEGPLGRSAKALRRADRRPAG